MTFPTQEHITAAQAAADRVKAKTGSFYCWPSATLAQALIESAGWTKLSGKNNGFGIKATAAQRAAGKATLRTTHEVIGGKTVTIQDWFADYDTLTDAYEAHAMLFVNVGVYAAGLKATSAKAFVNAIAPHYATAPNYATVILGVMDKQNLYQYDNPAGAAAKPAQPAPAPTAPIPAPAPPLPPVAAPASPAPVAASQNWFQRLLGGIAAFFGVRAA